MTCKRGDRVKLKSGYSGAGGRYFPEGTILTVSGGSLKDGYNLSDKGREVLDRIYHGDLEAA